MNSISVALIAVIILYIGYRFYGSVMEKLWDVNPERKTPAHTNYDGVDYIPAKNWTVLFGHHFASIAGAGPIIGPVIACLYWGWLSALLWLVFGSIFLGAVHDFSALMASVREGGKTIANVCGDVMGKEARIIFSLFLWLSLILVVAVFAAIGGNTLAGKPEIVIPAIGIIPLAVVTGILLYRTSLPQSLTTAAGIVLLTVLIILGNYFPVDISAFTRNPAGTWTVILLAYAFTASILPVNILLQPRDYLSTFLLFFGLFAGYLGVIITHPQMNAPAFIAESSAQGPMWPMMFVVIACGAISGFHSIVSSGTTSKQLPGENDAKKTGYGAMIVESALAVLALLAVAAGLQWSPAGGALCYPELMKKGWIIAFSEGFGQLTLPLFGAFGALIAATILNAFIITTLDTATRVTRYLTEEMFGIKNKFLSTSIITVMALYLALGNWKKIWPVFGASNQLVAALALLVASAYLMSKNKNSLYTLVPAALMLLTSGGALIWQLNNFTRQNNILLSFIAGLLLILAFYMSFVTIKYFLNKKQKLNEQPR